MVDRAASSGSPRWQARTRAANRRCSSRMSSQSGPAAKTGCSPCSQRRPPNGHPGRVIGMSMAGAGKGSTPAKDTDPLLWRLYTRGLLERDDPRSRLLMDWVAADEKWNLNDPDEVRWALGQMRGADVTWSVEVRARE